jgi:hypothetical protein
MKRRKEEAIRVKEEAWQKCTTPGQRALHSLDRFMDYYFLTNGRPDRTKTTEPLALYGYTSRHEMTNRAERIPRLENTSAFHDSERIVCIGWDRSAVWELASTIGAAAEAKKAKEEEDAWEETMEEHREFVANIKKKKKGEKGPVSEHEKLERCKGSYVVQCEELAGGWDNCDSLNIDIAAGPKSGILEAAVEFGTVESTMMLAFNETDLEAYMAVASEDSESDMDDYDEENDSEDDNQPTAPTSKKRKAITKATASNVGRGRPKKQAKTSADSSNRLFFRLRGRETGERVIFSNLDKGYLDFTNSDFVAFKGVGSMPAVGSAVPFEGFKVSAEAAAKAEPWSAFSEAAYEEERVSRWH